MIELILMGVIIIITGMAINIISQKERTIVSMRMVIDQSAIENRDLRNDITRAEYKHNVTIID